mmetsp:Transcript_36962/g.95863  ORF Transcript_36962/g.95863 Transcript_36962/m.95863 type:complete len:460 (-) Transcript_36962:215-1594(-)
MGRRARHRPIGRYSQEAGSTLVGTTADQSAAAVSSDVNAPSVHDRHLGTWKAGIPVAPALEVAVPAALSDTWLVLGQSLHVSRSLAAQKLQSGRHRVQALRHSLAERRRKRREARQAARLLEGLGSHDDTLNFVCGATAFGLMAFLAGAAPGLIPSMYICFFTYMVPLRTVYFFKRKWQFFLIDFCYWVNIATVIFLLFYPTSERFSALVFSMNEGPLSGALVVWQCAWVFGSREHTFSTLMHLLPGLAVHCNRYYNGPHGWRAIYDTVYRAVLNIDNMDASWTRFEFPRAETGWQWSLLAPFVFYCTWQLLYFLIVQVVFQKFIRDNQFQTSYTMLAKRAARSNTFWHKLVRQGTPMRRISMFGLIQLAFTVFTVLLSWPMYHSYRLSLLWQVVKIGVSLYYGSRMQCQVLPDRLGKLLIERHVAEQSKLALSVTHQPDEPQKQDQQQEEVQGAKCAE